MSVNVGLDDLLLITPIIVLFLGSLVPITFKLFNKNQEPSVFLVRSIPILAVVVAAFVSIALRVEQSRMAFDSALVFDGLSYWVSLIVYLAVAGSLCFIYEDRATRGEQLSERVFLLMNSAIGMLVMLWSNDLIITFIGLEMMSLALYLLVAMSHEQVLAKEAALKYFVLGSFASAIMLYGISFIYGMAGTTFLNELSDTAPKIIATNKLFLVGFFMVVLGFCFKASIFPFHHWTPDVYQGSPTSITAFMATGVKLVTFSAFLRFVLTEGLVGSETLVDVLQWMSVLTMVAGNTTAILQRNFKRMLAYSSVSHSGYILVGLISVGISPDSFEGGTGIVFYLFSYSIMTLGAFAFVSVFEKSENTALQVSDLKGLGAKYPVVSIGLTTLLLSLAGLPPTLGFFAKFYIFSAAMGEGLVWLTVWGLINSVIAVYYYLRPIVYMYMHDEAGGAYFDTKALTQMILALAVLSVIFAGLVSDPIYHSVEAAISSLF